MTENDLLAEKYRKIQSYQKAYFQKRKKNPQEQAKRLAYFKKWREKNKEKMKEYFKNWRAKKKEMQDEG